MADRFLPAKRAPRGVPATKRPAKTTNRPLSWEPVRRGKFYCSPACSRDGFCTWAGFLDAKLSGESIIKELGPGWKPALIENLGWHVCVTDESGLLRVYSHRVGSYCVIFDGHWSSSASTPRAAVVAAMNKALEGARAIAAVLGRVGMSVQIDQVPRALAAQDKEG